MFAKHESRFNPHLGLRNHFLSIELEDHSSTLIYPSFHVLQTLDRNEVPSRNYGNKYRIFLQFCTFYNARLFKSWCTANICEYLALYWYKILFYPLFALDDFKPALEKAYVPLCLK